MDAHLEKKLNAMESKIDMMLSYLFPELPIEIWAERSQMTVEAARRLHRNGKISTIKRGRKIFVRIMETKQMYG